MKAPRSLSPAPVRPVALAVALMLVGIARCDERVEPALHRSTLVQGGLAEERVEPHPEAVEFGAHGGKHELVAAIREERQGLGIGRINPTGVGIPDLPLQLLGQSTDVSLNPYALERFRAGRLLVGS